MASLVVSGGSRGRRRTKSVRRLRRRRVVGESAEKIKSVISQLRKLRVFQKVRVKSGNSLGGYPVFNMVGGLFNTNTLGRGKGHGVQGTDLGQILAGLGKCLDPLPVEIGRAHV